MSDIETYYTVLHPEEFAIDWRSFYHDANARTDEVRREFRHVLDQRYGPEPKQAADVYLPREAPGGPVFVFLHGGGFREGDRRQYGFVARPLLEAGIVVVVASYRLTPQATFPAQPSDAEQLVVWTHRHIATLGGDPRSLFVGGHSAGAILSAFAGVNRSWMDQRSLPRSILRAIVPVSGIYDLRDHPLDGYVDTAAQREQASPLLNVVDPPPSLVAVGGEEERFVGPAHDLSAALRAAGSESQLLILDGADHRQTVVALGDPTSPLAQELVELIGREG